jgi:hypothetical protein
VKAISILAQQNALRFRKPLEPFSHTSRTGLCRTKTEIGKCRPETAAQKPAAGKLEFDDLLVRDFRLEAYPTEIPELFTDLEAEPRRRDWLAGARGFEPPDVDRARECHETKESGTKDGTNVHFPDKLLIFLDCWRRGGGIAVAIAVTYSNIIRKGFYPVIIVSQVVPKISIAPLFIVWFGTGTISSLLLAFLVAFFPMDQFGHGIPIGR